jgi:hypothetical protein
MFIVVLTCIMYKTYYIWCLMMNTCLYEHMFDDAHMNICLMMYIMYLINLCLYI